MRKLRVLKVDNESPSTMVTCSRCRLRIVFSDASARLVPDLLASHWADDHHLVGWRDVAAEARGRLWRRHSELLERLTELCEPPDGRHGRTG